MAEQDIATIVAQADLPAIAAAFTSVKKRGHEYIARCVFHSPDDNPSLSIYHKGGKWNYKCFSCGEAGDALDWLEKLEGLDKAAAIQRLGGNATWTPRLPVPAPAPMSERVTSKPPAGSPVPDMKIERLGEPSRIFPIRDLDGSVIAYECRYEEPDGTKEVRIWSYGKRGDKPARWGVGHLNSPRPLYGLEQLPKRPNDPLLITEGPKKADSGKVMLPTYVSISWTGGANAWHKHDWSPCRGRTVLIFPDNDEPGITAAEKLAALLHDPKGIGCKVRIIDPNRMPDGWDIADAEKEGWSTEKLIEWAKPRARDYAPNPAPQAGGPPSAENAQTPPLPRGEPAGAGPKRKPQLSVVDGNTARQPAADAEPLPQAMSDDALADAFAETHGEDWRYVSAWARWFEWLDDRWLEDATGKHRQLARMITRQAVYWKDAQTLTPDAKRKINSARAAGALLQLAQVDRRIAATVDQWDTDSWLLGVPGGVVDLKTGKATEASREQYITKQCAVAPAAGKPMRYLEFLQRVTDGNTDLINFLHRCAGYWLTGSAREHSLTFLYGTGANGKSVFMRTLGGILGVDSQQYAASCQMTVFTESKMERHSTELARLRGARLVMAEETGSGARWDQAKIQWLTGEGSVTARFMRQDDFTFTPQFKLLFAGNHKPMLRSVDEAIKRRFHLVPFTITIPPDERDERLYEKLREEWPQILAWMIEGCLAWQDYKLAPPECVRDATDKYLETEDALAQWLEECCDRIDGAAESRSLWESWVKWCDANGEHAGSRRGWANVMGERGFAAAKGSGGRRMLSGLALKPGANLP